MVSEDDKSVGTLTQTMSWPFDESNFSISWESLVVPSDEVKRMSSAFAWALSLRSVSDEIEINRGKLL